MDIKIPVFALMVVMASGGVAFGYIQFQSNETRNDLDDAWVQILSCITTNNERNAEFREFKGWVEGRYEYLTAPQLCPIPIKIGN